MESLKNKQLVFLEKDYKCPNSDDCIDSAKVFLESWLNLPTEQVDAMKNRTLDVPHDHRGDQIVARTDHGIPPENGIAQNHDDKKQL